MALVGMGKIYLPWGRKMALAAVAASFCFSGPNPVASRYLPLFVIERSVNANVVHYDAKLGPDGKLDPREPVVAYWIMRAEDGRRQDLNLIERLKAYGFTTQASGADAYKLSIVSEKMRQILVTHEANAARAEMLIGGCHAYLQRIFVNTRKSMLLNFAESAELQGVDTTSGQPCREIIAAGR